MTKEVCDKLCDKMVCDDKEEEAAEEERRSRNGEAQIQKQEPHTIM